jgi:Mg-chelatase subunit ChlD
MKPCIGFLVLVLCCAAPTSVAQSPAPLQSSITLFAADKAGNPVTDLTVAELEFGGGENPIRPTQLKQLADAPLLLCLLIDESYSFHGVSWYREALKSVATFAEEVLADRRSSVMLGTFSITGWLSQPTRDVEFIRQQISLIEPHGGTAFYGALAAVAGRVAAVPVQEPTRKIIVVLSDGEDNLSRVTVAEAIAAAQRYGLPVFSIALPDTYAAPVPEHGTSVLKKLAEWTGGASYRASGAKQVAEQLSKLRGILAAEYLATYSEIPEQGKNTHPIIIRSTRKELRLLYPRKYTSLAAVH